MLARVVRHSLRPSWHHSRSLTSSAMGEVQQAIESKLTQVDSLKALSDL